MKTMKRFLGVLLSFVFVLGSIPGMSLTAYAQEYSNWDGDSIQLESGDTLNIQGTESQSGTIGVAKDANNVSGNTKASMKVHSI